MHTIHVKGYRLLYILASAGLSPPPPFYPSLLETVYVEGKKSLISTTTDTWKVIIIINFIK